MEAQVRTMVEQIAAQVAALKGGVDEAQVRAIVQESMAPVYAEMQALGQRRAPIAGTDGGRTAKLAGTRYAQIVDPNSGRAWTADDVEFLHDILENGQRAGLCRGPSEKLRNLHADIHTRAMDTAESGYGAELVGVEYIRQLWDSGRAASMVFSQLPTFEMTAPSAYLPVAAAPPEMLFVAESTASNASDYTTSKTGSNRTLVTAKKFVIHQMWSGEMEEDSIIPFVPFLREQAAWSVGYYSDSLVINGDTTNEDTGNINLDDANPADTKHYLAFDGLRHACLVDNTNNLTNQAAAVDYNALLGMRTKMLDRTYFTDWGAPVNPQDLIYIAGPETAEAITQLDETLTVDKYGPAATVITGEVTKIGRHPLIRSIAVPLTEADGKVSTTGGNNTKGQVVAFNKRGYVIGWRRMLKVELERIPATDQSRIVYSLRLGLGRYSPTGAASGIESACVMYNITV